MQAVTFREASHAPAQLLRKWPQLLTWLLAALTVAYTIFLLVGVKNPLSPKVVTTRLIFPVALLITSFVMVHAARSERDRRRLGWTCEALSAFSAAIGALLFSLVRMHIVPEIGDRIIEIGFFLPATLSIVGIALYFPWQSFKLGTGTQIVVNSIIAGFVFMLACYKLIPIAFPWLVWSAEMIVLFEYVAQDIAILFAVLLMMTRFGPEGGPLFVYVFFAVLCLALGDALYALLVWTGNARWSITGVPFSMLYCTFVSFAAYRSIEHPPLDPQNTSSPRLLEGLSWDITPRMLLLFAFGIVVFAGPVAWEISGSLVAITAVHELIIAQDYWRVVGAWRTAQRDAQTARSELEQRDLLRAREVQSAAHDLRNSLQTLQGVMEDLVDDLRGTQLSSELAELHELRFRLALKTQAMCIESMRDAVLLEQGRLALEPQPIDLVGMVREQVMQFEPSFAAQACRLIFELEDELPTVWCDPSRIERVVHNLLHNALKFTSQHWGRQAGGAVWVTLDQRDGYAGCRIRDNGPGISADELARLGRPFVRGSAAQSDGLGLGLSFSKAVVELNGGVFEIDSDGAGQGTTTTILLPSADAAQPRARS